MFDVLAIFLMSLGYRERKSSISGVRKTLSLTSIVYIELGCLMYHPDRMRVYV